MYLDELGLHFLYLAFRNTPTFIKHYRLMYSLKTHFFQSADHTWACRLWNWGAHLSSSVLERERQKVRSLFWEMLELFAEEALFWGEKKSEKSQNVWLKTKVRKVQKTEPWWMYILKKCTNSADCAIPLWCWVELEGWGGSKEMIRKETSCWGICGTLFMLSGKYDELKTGPVCWYFALKCIILKLFLPDHC